MPPTLTCGSSQATQGYSSTSWLVLTLLWKYCKTFITLSTSCHSSSSTFCKFSTKSELRFSNCTSLVSSTARCILWCIGWKIHVIHSASNCNSSTLFAHCCFYGHNTVTYCCNFLIYVALAIFCAKGNYFISFFTWVTFVLVVHSSYMRLPLVRHIQSRLPKSERLGRQP